MTTTTQSNGKASAPASDPAATVAISPIDVETLVVPILGVTPPGSTART
jgi:hypothetical protein